MKKMGFRSSKDVAKSEAHRSVAQELLELQAQIEALQARQVRYESAIEQTHSNLRRLARQRILNDLGVSGDDFDKLAQAIGELDDRLRTDRGNSAVTKVELDTLLKETFTDTHNSTTEK